MDMKVMPITDGWHGLWNRIGAQSHGAWDVYLELFEKYTQRHRYYHMFPHILHMLKEFEEIKHLCIQPNAVEMAIYFHDETYDPAANDNEEKSAARAKTKLDSARLPEPGSQAFIHEVVRLIMLTKKHETIPEDVDGSLLLDIDLSILGQQENISDTYEHNIWKEYVYEGVVSDVMFAERRADILRKFLKRKFIYQTPYFWTKYEKKARENLQRSVRQLDGKRNLVAV